MYFDKEETFDRNILLISYRFNVLILQYLVLETNLLQVMSYWNLATYGYIRRIERCIGNDCVIPDDVMILCARYSHEYNFGPSIYYHERYEEVERDDVYLADRFIVLFPTACAFLLGAFVIATLGMYITGFVMTDLKNVMILTILAISLISSIFGAIATYKCDTIRNVIYELKEENTKYEYQLNEIHGTRKHSANRYDEIQTVLMNGEYHLRELNEITNDLEELCNMAGDNEDMLILLDKTHEIHNNMRKVVLETQRTHLLSKFYECIFRDDDDRMDEQEYNRFIGQSTKRVKEIFRLFMDGYFPWEDGIDLQEFADFLGELLIEIDGAIYQLSLIINSY